MIREASDLRRWRKPFCSSGSVSVYMIAVTAAIVLLAALLIDFARIAAFRRQAEWAVQAGVRSVLSAYDPGFYEKYGLFIRGGDDGRELFRTAAEGHFTGTRSSGVFPYIDAQFMEEDVTESRPLADFDVLHRQVLEEMKYKAPIDLTLELSGRFRGLAPAMKEAAETVTALEKLRKLYDRRESALDAVLSAQRQEGQAVWSRIRGLVPYPPAPLAGNRPAGPVGDVAEAVLAYEDYAAKSDEVLTDDEGDPLHAAAISAYESGMRSLSSALISAAGSIRSEAGSFLNAAEAEWLRAKETNEEMREVARAASAVSPSDPTGEPDAVGRENTSRMAEIRRSAEQLVLEPGYFDELREELESQQRKADELAREAERFAALAASAVNGGGGSGLKDAASRLQNLLSEYLAEYGSEGSVVQRREAEMQSRRSFEGERKSQEERARSDWSAWKRLIEGLNGQLGSPEERDQFRKTGERAKAYLAWNEAEDEAAETASADEPSEERDRSLAKATGWLGALRETAGGAGEKLYFSEYTVARMSLFPPSQAKRLIEGSDVPLPPDSQEAEYVLYGFANPTGNLAAAYGEIFALRLAIRTVEGLIECRGMGHPLVVLAAALAYGIRHAVSDIAGLLDRDVIRLSKYVAADTSYRDYLRLFLLAQGGSPGFLSRMAAVMEHETGLDLTRTYTYVRGEGTAALRLWFFPGLLRLMGRTGQLGGEVIGHRYEARYAAEFAYQ